MKVLVHFFVIAVVSAAACTKPNPAVCCVDPQDCASIGAQEDMRPCPTALACVDHECVVPDCSTQGCLPSMPVCNLATNTCEGCGTNADCANVPDQGICDAQSGACVQCLVSTDCGATVPVCDNQTCRKCSLDSECSSGACANDGTCVPESAIVYVDPVGDDAGDCARGTPCRSLPFAVSRTTVAKNHLVMAKATYSSTLAVVISTDTTSAQSLNIHGHGSSISSASVDGIILARIPVAIRDLNLEQAPLGNGPAIETSASTPSTLERIRVHAHMHGIKLTGPASIRDVTVEAITRGQGVGVSFFTGTNEIDRLVARGWDTCVVNSGVVIPVLTARNMVVHDCATRGLDLGTANAVIEFSTIAYSGAGIGTSARAVDCGNGGGTLRSSIVWTPNSDAPVQGCNLVGAIVGPAAIAGASNSDPRFVDGPGGDLRLLAGSPARDAADTGPATDVAGNARPIGPRFDLGAYETQ